MSKQNLGEEAGNQRLDRLIAITQKYYRKLSRRRKLALLTISVSMLLGGWGFFGFLEYLFYLPAVIKTVLIFLLLTGTGAVVWILRQRLTLTSFSRFYHNFSQDTDLPALSDALDLQFDDSNSSTLTSAAIQQNIDTLNFQDVESALSEYVKKQRATQFLQIGYTTLSASVLLLLFFAYSQPQALNRFAHAWHSYVPPNPYSYHAEPGTITLEQGDSFTPRLRFEGSGPDDISLQFKTDIEDNYRSRSPVAAGGDSVTFSPVSFNADGRYYFVMDGYESPIYSVGIQLRPRFEELQLTVIPPSYTGLESQSYNYPFSKIQAYYGSEIKINSVANKPITELVVERSSRDTLIPMTPDPDSAKRFTYSWKPSERDTVSFQMIDSAGLANKNEFRFIADLREDEYPFVDLAQPEKDLQLKSPEPIELEYEAGDDFGLTSATLKFEVQRAFSPQAEEGSIQLPKPEPNQLQTDSWNLSPLDLKPRDTITFWVEVADNDPLKGPKIAQSQRRTITLSSMTDYLDELEDRESDVSQSLQDVSESYNQMQQEFERFKQQLKENPDAGWEEKQSLEQIRRKQEEVDSKVEELNKKFEQLRREMEENRTLSPETQKAYDDLQKLMKEINDPALQEALEELQKSLENIRPGELEKALENYEFNEQLYRERINRTMELFKSLKLNSDLDKLARSLDELAEQEKKLINSERPASEDAKRQEAVREDLNGLQEQIQKLQENAPDKAKNRIEKLQDEADNKVRDIDNQLKKNIDELNERDDAPASPQTREQQRNIQQQMQQLSQQMQNARQQMNSQNISVNIAALKYILYSLLNLSENQEELTKETEKIPNRSQAFVEKAREERNIARQFNSLSDSLYHVSAEIPGFSNRINQKKAEVNNQIDRAVEQLSERNRSNATYLQRQSLGGINELSSMIASLIEQLQNQQGGGSGSMTMQQFLEQMKNLSGDQQKLNQQIQEMINDIQGDRLSQDQIERLNQMARQQNEIRKQIQELQKSGQLESGDRVLSELERLSEEMENTINEIRGGQLDEHLKKRQQNILSRMLSAEEAMQERGEERREATTAEEQQERVSPDITMEELQKKIRKMLNDPERTPFTDDYQRLIEQYFELLRKLQ